LYICVLNLPALRGVKHYISFSADEQFNPSIFCVGRLGFYFVLLVIFVMASCPICVCLVAPDFLVPVPWKALKEVLRVTYDDLSGLCNMLNVHYY
jgi:hypothetical protein